jgi:hypothetical protein
MKGHKGRHTFTVSRDAVARNGNDRSLYDIMVIHILHAKSTK